MWLACSAVQNCPCKDIWATTQLFLGLKTGHQLLPQIYPVIPVIKDPRRAFPAPYSWLAPLSCPAQGHRQSLDRLLCLKAQSESSHCPQRPWKHLLYDHLALEPNSAIPATIQCPQTNEMASSRCSLSQPWQGVILLSKVGRTPAGHNLASTEAVRLSDDSFQVRPSASRNTDHRRMQEK